jgi:hypothetical protein
MSTVHCGIAFPAAGERNVMALAKVRIGAVEVTRLAIGGNPFSGFSHQSPARDRQMRKYYTVERIKRALRKAEAAGVNTFFGRADNHVIRMLEEYWDEGGKIQWFAQTAAEQPDYLRNISTAANAGAKGVYLHGGQTDFFWSHKETGNFAKALERMRALGVAAGFAGHACEPHEWIRDNLSCDFQLCCYYDPSSRADRPEHVTTDEERFDPAHRDRMARTIATLKSSAVHYKVLAAGRTPAQQAFDYVAKVLRPQDVVLVGFFLGDNEDLIEQSVSLFERTIQPKAG